jgi:hypothetical protein
MKKSMLITRPEHDDITHYLSKLCAETIALANSKSMLVFDLLREKAVKDEVESRLSKSSPNLVIFNGHGSDNHITGYKNLPLIIAGQNETLLKSKIVYAISCRSASVLGPCSIKAGALSYTGYDDDFIFMYEPAKLSKPLTDVTAKLFLEHSQRFTESLIKGNTVEESFKRSKDNLKDNLLKMMNSDKKDSELAKYLWWDLKHLVTHGDLNTKV